MENIPAATLTEATGGSDFAGSYKARLEHGERFWVPLESERMSCADAETLLVAPLDSSELPHDYRPYLYGGLRVYTYPNGIVHKNAGRMSREVQLHLRHMVPDAKNLVHILEAEAMQDQVVVAARIADDAQASLHARERLVTMKPSRLAALCQEFGVPIDELALWKLKGGDRHNREIRLYDLDDLGSDSEQLRRQLTVRLFKRIDLLDEAGVQVSFIPHDDLLSPSWLQNVSLGERGKPLSLGKEGLPRYEVKFRSGVVTKREIVPVIGWAAVGKEFGRWISHRERPEYMGSRLHFDETTRRLTLYSPMMGAVLLAGQAKLPADMHRQAFQFFGRSYDRHGADYTRRYGRRLPRTAVAALPAVLTKRENGAALLRTPLFRSVQQQTFPGLPLWLHY